MGHRLNMPVVSNSPERSLREALRWLLLPIQVGEEDSAVIATCEILEGIGVDIADGPVWLEVGLDEWRTSGRPDHNFKSLVEACIAAPNDEIGRRLASHYFELHSRLRGQPRFDHDMASALMSHARLIVLLATDEKLSASQISALIAVRDRRVPVSWKQVQMILQKVKLTPQISVDAVEAIYLTDEALEIEGFGDADEGVCAEMVATVGAQLGFAGDLLGALNTLLPNDHAPFGPYLQILHYQCTIAEYYDHALGSIYEFKPRGKATRWLLKKYPPALEVAAENPFLNNAKGVDQLNDAWARSRKNEEQVRLAHALVAIIAGLDTMGYAAKRELAAWLRRLLVRRIRLAEEHVVPLPSVLDAGHARTLLQAVSESETHTKGIIEQRIVDAVAAHRHPAPQWIARGLLDSINATNISSRKCGDCDFQDTTAHRVVAYEAHAGKLTDIYLEGHLRSLEAVLKLRVQEWKENIGSVDDWNLSVAFVAHEIPSLAPIRQDIAGVEVTVETIRFEQFLSGFDTSDVALAALNTYVRDPLAESRTPNSVRRSYLNLIEPEEG